MVSAADKDKSGYLDKEEFLALVARKWEHLEEVSNFKLKKIYFSYESFSDVGEIRVWFASKILTPCRMH